MLPGRSGNSFSQALSDTTTFPTLLYREIPKRQLDYRKPRQDDRAEIHNLTPRQNSLRVHLLILEVGKSNFSLGALYTARLTLVVYASKVFSSVKGKIPRASLHLARNLEALSFFRPNLSRFAVLPRPSKIALLRTRGELSGWAKLPAGLYI
ncbi:uncharacterized protein H6S33_003247 [Morchella sextelata]|uniref:uncharacterized protein n=1 Tax=Morchella sextelata TaxID=1174677 RepID=UPI001D037E57|nr:uncharacterized protein H6S33_003247 [Morchella sextelata]KAH0607259.1 hypothetical protein H6S33_003247 [Morchella sextelata]